ncbi:unnamed protein product [Mucor hiemalis]
MGCCMSNDKISTIEVVLDENGVARRVAPGQGTHLIRKLPDNETKMERKSPTKPSQLSNLSRPEAIYYPAKFPMMTSCFPSTKRVYPNTSITDEDKIPVVTEDHNEKS